MLSLNCLCSEALYKCVAYLQQQCYLYSVQTNAASIVDLEDDFVH